VRHGPRALVAEEAHGSSDLVGVGESGWVDALPLAGQWFDPGVDDQQRDLDAALAGGRRVRQSSP